MQWQINGDKMKKYWKQTEDEPLVNLIIEGYCNLGQKESGRWGPPENYDPGEPADVEDFAVFLCDEKGGDRIDITRYLKKQWIEAYKEELLDDYADSLRYDNDMAYELRAGK